MARDYAARNRKPAAKPAGLPGWVWLVAGLSMGLIVACIVYIGRPTEPMPMAPAAGAAAKMAKAREKSEIPPKTDPRFEFYDLLEDEQVVVSGQPTPRAPKPATPVPPTRAPADVAVAAPAPRPAPITAPSPAPAASTGGGSSSERYIVLAGSFRELGNAEQHRARLAMSGIEARIDTVQLQEGGTVHRVRIGPAPRAQAERTVALLHTQGIDGRMIAQQP